MCYSFLILALSGNPQQWGQEGETTTTMPTSNFDDPTRIHHKNVSEFEALLTQAADIHSIEMTTHPGRINFSAQAGRAIINFTFLENGAVEIIESDLRHLLELSDHRRSHHQKHAHLSGAPIEELERLDLPLYWNKEWLEEKHEETGSYAALAQKYKKEVQGAKASSIANYAREKFHVSPRDKLLGSRDDLVNEYEEVHETTSQTALAAKYGVTVSTVNRWKNDAHRAYHEMTENPELVKNKEAIAVFASQHNLLPRTINKWKRIGSKVYSQPVKAQPKQTYHTRSDYARLRQQLYDRLDASPTGELPDTGVALAEQYGVNRSTIKEWLLDYKANRNLYGSN